MIDDQTTYVNGYGIEPWADLAGANLAGTNLRRADLAVAYLAGVNLRGANLGGGYFRGAFADEDTIWPEGFDPGTAGVIFE